MLRLDPLVVLVVAVVVMIVADHMEEEPDLVIRSQELPEIHQQMVGDIMEELELHPQE